MSANSVGRRRGGQTPVKNITSSVYDCTVEDVEYHNVSIVTHIRHLVRARHGYAVTSSTLLADPPSNETIDVFYIKTSLDQARSCSVYSAVARLAAWRNV